MEPCPRSVLSITYAFANVVPHNVSRYLGTIIIVNQNHNQGLYYIVSEHNILFCLVPRYGVTGFGRQVPL